MIGGVTCDDLWVAINRRAKPNMLSLGSGNGRLIGRRARKLKLRFYWETKIESQN